MFLKTLQIKGFKSFADAATLTLEPGVTVVVGSGGGAGGRGGAPGVLPEHPAPLHAPPPPPVPPVPLPGGVNPVGVDGLLPVQVVRLRQPFQTPPAAPQPCSVATLV